jgi:hypothetical protein
MLMFEFNLSSLVLLCLMVLIYGKAMQGSGRLYEAGKRWEYDALAGLVFLAFAVVLMAMAFSGVAPIE